MTEFLCWFHPSRPLAPGALPLPAESLDHVGDGGCGMAGTPARVEDELLVAVAGEPFWRDAGLADLASERGHAAALARAWRQFGSDFLERIAGAFSVVVIDRTNRRMTAAIDRFGQASLWFVRCRDGVVVATTPRALASHPDVRLEQDVQSIHDYLYFHMIPAPATPYTGIGKLPAAQRLAVSGDQVERRRYWTPAFGEAAIDREEAGAELRSALEIAVGLRLEPGTGSFLSGGLDSSTVTGLQARLQPEEASAFSIGFDVPGYDEIPFARLAAKHFGTPLCEYYVTPADVADSVQTVVASFDEPFGNSSALPAYFCARLAREAGVSRLLAGDGGDELFAGNARYAKQQVFEYYGRIPGPVRRGLLEPAALGPAGHLPGLRKVRSYVRQALVPLPDRLESYNFLNRLDPESVFTGDFLSSINREHPIRHLRKLYSLPQEASALNRMMFLDWQITLADNDLRKVNGACRLAGIDVSYPMLDDDVVALACRIPSRDKLRSRQLRAFYKDSFRGFLPDAVIDKRKHGFGLPFGLWLRDDRRLHELAGDMLAVVRDQGWIRPEFIDELFNRHLQDHPAFYGEFVWVLMALGIWHQEQERRPAAGSVA